MKKRELLICFLALAFAAGCGQNVFEGQENKGSGEATQLDVAKKLDSGNYAAVLNDPNVNATDYAAAAMGAAGIDPVNLVKKVNEMSQNGNTSNLSAVTSIPITPENLQYLALAGERLSAITFTAPSFHAPAAAQAIAITPKNENYFQRTLVDIVYVVTALAQIGKENSGAAIIGTFDPSNGISEAEATALGNFIADKATNNQLDNLKVHTKYNADGSVDATGDVKLVDAISGKVAEVVSFITPTDQLGVGTDSEIYKTLKSITTGQKSLNYRDTGVSGDLVTGAELSDYLYCVVGNHSSGSTIPNTSPVRTCL